jgi:hypothetical protein
MTTINNEWITIMTEVDGQLTPKLRNGVRVQRKFAGLDTHINENNGVVYCRVKYYERELYPTDEVIKIELKWYSLEDLPETVNDIEGWRQESLGVLSGFIDTLGYPGIINPSRETLENELILPLTSINGYPLRRDTREKITL